MFWGTKKQPTLSSSSSTSWALSSWFTKVKKSLSGKLNVTQNPKRSENHKPTSTLSSNASSVVSPPHLVRSSSVSDHLSFSPATLDHGLGKGELPRHSYCGGEVEFSCVNCQNERRRERERGRGGSFGVGRSKRSESDFLSLADTCRKCRSDLLRSGSERLSRIPARSKVCERFGDVCVDLKPIQTSASGRKDPDPICKPRRSVSGKARRRSGVKVCSPRLSVRRTTARRKVKSLESFAVVKCSTDPQRDFKESMVEMILENRMARPEELESLLACYLSLNSDEYHDVIVEVFRQVWFDLNPDRLVVKSDRKVKLAGRVALPVTRRENL